MDEFMDPVLGRMVAIGEADSCIGCAYEQRPCPTLDGVRGSCLALNREDRRDIIWVRAEDAPQAPKAVRLTDGQIIELRKTTQPLPGQWGDTKAFARAIEAAALRANNLEIPE